MLREVTRPYTQPGTESSTVFPRMLVINQRLNSQQKGEPTSEMWGNPS